VGLCSTSQIRGEEAPPVRTSGVGNSLHGGGEVVRHENDCDGLATERAELRPGRNPRAKGGIGTVGDTLRSRQRRRSR